MGRVLLTLFLPPVRVWLRSGLGGPFWLCLLLTLLWWLPGVLFAFWYARRSANRAADRPPRKR